MQLLPDLSSTLRSVFLLLILVMLPIAVHSSSNVIDWAKQSSQTTDANCGTMTLTHLKDGESYNLLVRGKNGGTCSFQADGLTFRYPPNYGGTTVGAMTVFSFQRFGQDVVVSWIPGY